MKRLFFILLILFSGILLCTCNISSNYGKLYITDQTKPGSKIITVKILKHSSNQSSERNIIDEYTELISYREYNWYMYEIPEGLWDIYIEYYDEGKYKNNREEVFIQNDSSGLSWVAIWLIDNINNSVMTEQGKQNFNINKKELF